MVKYVKGDLFDTNCDIIAHGCNCKGVMGSGVAKAVREKYPKAYNSYVELYEEDGIKLGDVQLVFQRDGKYIANCFTQDAFLPRTRCHADYRAITQCMVRLKNFAKDKGLSIAIPKIGAGLAGGDWNKIEAILKSIFTDDEVFGYDVTVYHLD